MWRACRASTKVDFDEATKIINYMDEGAYNYLMAEDPSHWSLHAFNESTKSDCLLNNMCESFNKMILQARDKPILTCMEFIRRMLMKRFILKQESIAKMEGLLVPKAYAKLENLKREVRHCKTDFAGNGKFEVRYKEDDTYIVDLGTKRCGCNKWQLSGLPCIHGVAALVKIGMLVEEFVHEAYTKETYILAYAMNISPLPGMKQWPKTDYPEPDPPQTRIMPGRPKKRRRREIGEQAASTQKLKRKKVHNKCGNCGQRGHNKKSCKNPTQAKAPPKKGGRPKKLSQGGTSQARQQQSNTGATQGGTSQARQQQSNTGATQEMGQIPSMTTTNLSQAFTPTEDYTPGYSPTPAGATPNATRGNVCISVAQVREAAHQLQPGKKIAAKPAWKP